MIYLDTHVVVWLYAGLVDKLSPGVKDLVNDNEIRISPIVRLELQYLYEIQRVTHEADVIVADLSHRLGVQICDREFNAIVSRGMTIPWTRDPFDRLIVAHADLGGEILISADQRILANYPHARW